MNVLNFPGNCSDADGTRPMGPDLYGAYYLPVSTEYDPEADRTTMRLRPLPPAELAEFIESRRSDTEARLDVLIGLAGLFGGGHG